MPRAGFLSLTTSKRLRDKLRDKTMPKGYFFVEVEIADPAVYGATAGQSRISSQVMEAEFSGAAETRNRSMASYRTAAVLLSSSIVLRP